MTPEPSRLRAAFRPTPLYLLAVALFVAHQLSQKFLGVRLAFVDDYLDPFLSIPLLLGLARAERRWLFGAGDGGPFGAVEVAAMTLFLAVLFEEGFPRLDPARQTRDAWDYLAYGLGGVAYYVGSARSAGAAGAVGPRS